MDAKDYLNFCQNTYRDELRDRDQFVPRQGFLLTGIVVIAGVVVKLATLDRLEHALHRIDVLAYYVATAAALAALAFAVYNLARGACPRVYEQISNLTEYDVWRDEIRKILETKSERSAEDIEKVVGNETGKALATRMNEATGRNLQQNLTRTKYFNRTMYSIFAAVIFFAMQMLAALVFTIWPTQGP